MYVQARLQEAAAAAAAGDGGAAAAGSGIALTLLPVFYAHAGFGGMPPTVGQRRFVHSVDAFARSHVYCGEALAHGAWARFSHTCTTSPR